MKNALFERVATAPISWGVCEVPGWGVQLSVDRVLSEMADLGFTHTELGSAGWLPAEPEPLKATLDRHGLSLLAAFIPLVLHQPDQTDSALAEAEAAAGLLGASGAPLFNTAPVTSADWRPREPSTEAQWELLVENLARVDAICADHGLTQVVHEHVGCVIETKAEVERLLATTNVKLVLDTGHLVAGGYDPLELATEHADRVGLVHLKDARLDVVEQLDHGELTLMAAVQAGLFPSLGEGDIDLTAVVETMERSGYDGWYVIEQDCAITGAEPPPDEGPKTDVAISIDYLRKVSAFAPAAGLASASPGEHRSQQSTE